MQLKLQKCVYWVRKYNNISKTSTAQSSLDHVTHWSCLALARLRHKMHCQSCWHSCLQLEVEAALMQAYISSSCECDQATCPSLPDFYALFKVTSACLQEWPTICKCGHNVTVWYLAIASTYTMHFWHWSTRLFGKDMVSWNMCGGNSTNTCVETRMKPTSHRAIV